MRGLALMSDRKSFREPKGTVRTGTVLLPAVCVCGHKGKSQRPEHYLCSGCYYAAWATSELEKATTLEVRARKLRADAAVHQAKSDAFRLRHPKGKKKP